MSMNTETGKVYDTQADAAAAYMRGEDLVTISRHAGGRIKAGRQLLARALREKRRNRKRDHMAHESRKANR
jgi:hypothetical protein